MKVCVYMCIISVHIHMIYVHTTHIFNNNMYISHNMLSRKN